MKESRNMTEKAGMRTLRYSALQRIVLICGLTLFMSGVFVATPGQRQSDAEVETVEIRLTELFDLCQQGKTDVAAAYFVYRGADESREWLDTFHASDAAEKAGVGELCLRIKSYLDESEGYRFSAVKVERESEGDWYVLEVAFRQADGQTKKVRFAFLLIKGEFSIGDIDG